MTSPEFLAPGENTDNGPVTAKSVNDPIDAREQDYQDFLAWKRSRDTANTPPQDTVNIVGDPRSSATVPPVTDSYPTPATRESEPVQTTQDKKTMWIRESEPVQSTQAAGRGWQGGDLAKPAPKPEPEKEEEPQSYIWLADGSVERVLDADLPGHAGVGAENGHWEKDGKVFQIVAVYPVEIEPKKEK